MCEWKGKKEEIRMKGKKGRNYEENEKKEGKTGEWEKKELWMKGKKKR